MYFSNVCIDAVSEAIPELFNFQEAGDKFFVKKTKTDEDLVESAFPVEPVLWPVDAAHATIHSYRGSGATAIVSGGGDALMIQLNTGSNYASFQETKYMEASIHVSPQSGTVLNDSKARSLWANVADGVRAPMIGGDGVRSADAAMSKYVKDGRHVEGVAARLIALSIEHALVPFTQRTRVRNAAACYWCVGKYKADGITFSLQNVQSLGQWAHAGDVGEEHDPAYVVWVDSADKMRGMSLLSRIMDAGGPILLQDSFLLRQADPGRLLMAGYRSLPREFAAIQPGELQLAIDEAMWILETFNGLSKAFVANMTRLLLRNLPIVDITHYREVEPIFWRVREGQFGQPDLGGGIEAIVDAAIDRAFPEYVRDALGMDDDIKRGALSDLFRREAFAPGVGLDGFAPGTNTLVGWTIGGFLAAMQGPAMGQVDGQNVHFSEFNAGMAPIVPNVPAFTREAMDGVHAAFSGRAGFHIYGYSQAIVGGVFPAPGGWMLCAVAPDAMPLPVGVVQDGAWLEWVGGNDPNGVPFVMTGVLRAYVVRQWLPVSHHNYMAGYTAPSARLRRFDIPQDFRMAVRPNGAWPDLVASAPRCAAFVEDSAGGNDPLDYLTPDGQRTLAGLTNGQKALALMRAIAFLWDASAIARTQNDAFARWTAANHAGRELTTVPDECMVYLGGIRSRCYIEPCGGLWTLCFQEHCTVTKSASPCGDVLAIMRDRTRLAAYILKLRSAIEMSDQMLRMSNARIAGCREPFLWPVAVDDRLSKARIDGLTTIDGATYLARQALVLATVFDHPDAAVARTFSVHACSTFRLREPRVGVALTMPHMKHMNWMTPQVMPYRAWANYYGVAAPTFIPDRVGCALLRNARYTTEWQEIDDTFLAGAMMNRFDEVWCAMLTAYAYTDWYPAALEIVNYGIGMRVDVSDVRLRHVDGFTIPAMRLNLPYETRMAIVTIHGAGHIDLERPDLACSDVQNVANGDQLFGSAIDYDARGRVRGINLDPNAVDFENMDLCDTSFARDGVSFATLSPTAIKGEWLQVERSTGMFWMHEVPTVGKVAAGMSAGAQRLLAHLAPPEPVAAINDGGGGEVVGAARVMASAPDVSKVKPPGVAGAGNIGMVELNLSSADTLLSSLSGLSEEARLLMQNALAKVKPTSPPERRVSNETAATGGLTPDNTTKESSS